MAVPFSLFISFHFQHSSTEPKIFSTFFIRVKRIVSITCSSRSSGFKTSFPGVHFRPPVLLPCESSDARGVPVCVCSRVRFLIHLSQGRSSSKEFLPVSPMGTMSIGPITVHFIPLLPRRPTLCTIFSRSVSGTRSPFTYLFVGQPALKIKKKLPMHGCTGPGKSRSTLFLSPMVY